jgi:hypothetical protein
LLWCKRFKVKELGIGILNERTKTWIDEDEIKEVETYMNIKMEVPEL